MRQRNRRTVTIAAGAVLVVLCTLMTISGGLAFDTLAASGTLTPMAYLPYIGKQPTPTSTPSGLPTKVPVSTEPAQEYAPQIARHGYQVYVTWYTGNNSYVKASTAGGWAWGLPVTIIGRHPTTAVDVNGAVYVCYDYSGTVYCIQSADGGQTFTSPLSLGAGCSPDIAVDASGKLYVVWQEQCSGPDAFTNVILARLIVQAYGPINLMATITKTVVGRTSINYSEPPKVAVSPSGQHVYVIWKCPPIYGNYVRTYFARSTNSGNTFEPRFNPTGFVRHGEYSPDVAAFGENIVYITWVLDQYGNWRTHFARSGNSGRSFSPRLELGKSGSDYDSTIAADDRGQVCVAWRQDAGQGTDLYLRCSINGGQSFQPARLLVSGLPGTSQYKPALVLWNGASATYLDAVWEDTRNGNRDIYFSTILVR
jgi:hypothetical protein